MRLFLALGKNVLVKTVPVNATGWQDMGMRLSGTTRMANKLTFATALSSAILSTV
jgi:hypothetical protein